jgi:hypothetical protein
MSHVAKALAHPFAATATACIAGAILLAGCAHSPPPAAAPPFSPFDRASRCGDTARKLGALTLQRLRARDGRCEIVVKPSRIRVGRYRSFQISSTGSIAVFNSFSESLSSRRNAMRCFFLFPRVRTPRFRVLPGGALEVVTAADEAIRFSTRTGQIESMPEGLAFELRPGRNPRERGGLEILRYARGLVLDAGWQYGGVAHRFPWKHSVFTDAHGQHCIVKNRELFRLRRGEPYLRAETDAELVGFLETRCPGLDLGPLRGRIAVPDARP